jgi:lysophospholipid acyltransferase (LPLAT)-like uncharacterized protein
VTLRQARLIAALAALVVRAIVATLRFRIDDRADFLQRPHDRPLIWLFWHNRFFVIPHLFAHFLKGRRGAALTSASKDGEILAGVLARFGIQPVRGSSSRRGATALRELIRIMAEGSDVAITPDGPRGPRYEMHAGVLILAQKSGTPVLPIRVEYSRCWRLKSWDAFMIPQPFARVDITLLPLEEIVPTDDRAQFESERLRLQAVLRAEQE